MCLRQSCVLLQTTAFGICTRDVTAALLRRRYCSGFADNTRVAADRGKSRNVGAPVVTASHYLRKEESAREAARNLRNEFAVCKPSLCLEQV